MRELLRSMRKRRREKKERDEKLVVSILGQEHNISATTKAIVNHSSAGEAPTAGIN